MEFGQICLNKKDRLAVIIILAALLAHALDTLQKVVKIKIHVRIYYSVIFMLGTCQQFMKRSLSTSLNTRYIVYTSVDYQVGYW
jgi:hypothetical protein